MNARNIHSAGSSSLAISSGTVQCHRISCGTDSDDSEIVSLVLVLRLKTRRTDSCLIDVDFWIPRVAWGFFSIGRTVAER